VRTIQNPNLFFGHDTKQGKWVTTKFS